MSEERLGFVAGELDRICGELQRLESLVLNMKREVSKAVELSKVAPHDEPPEVSDE